MKLLLLVTLMLAACSHEETVSSIPPVVEPQMIVEPSPTPSEVIDKKEPFEPEAKKESKKLKIAKHVKPATEKKKKDKKKKPKKKTENA